MNEYIICLGFAFPSSGLAASAPKYSCKITHGGIWNDICVSQGPSKKQNLTQKFQETLIRGDAGSVGEVKVTNEPRWGTQTQATGRLLPPLDLEQQWEETVLLSFWEEGPHDRSKGPVGTGSASEPGLWGGHPRPLFQPSNLCCSNAVGSQPTAAHSWGTGKRKPRTDLLGERNQIENNQPRWEMLV